MNMSWDDYRFALKVAEHRTLSGAATDLDVSHPTVYRRLRSLEARLGVRLFERHRDGYTPTQAGEELAAMGRDLEGRFAALEQRLAGRDIAPTGIVRLTVPDTIAEYLLPPILAELRSKHPGIRPEVVVTNQFLPLTQREADIAIRATERVPETLVGRVLGQVDVAAYARRDTKIAENDSADVETIPWIGHDGSLAHLKAARWLNRNVSEKAIVYRANSLLGMLGAARAGIGAALLPRFVGEADPGLRRIAVKTDDLSTPLWLLTHRELRRVPRIRITLDAIAEWMRRNPFPSIDEG